MNTTATRLIDAASVLDTYSGACGCLGTYAKTAAAVTRRANEINKAIANGEQVAVYAYSDEVVYEYTKPNGRVIRVYTDKSDYVANN